MFSRPAAPTDSINGPPSSSSISTARSYQLALQPKGHLAPAACKPWDNTLKQPPVGKYWQSLPSVPQYTEAGHPADESVSYAIGPKLPEESYYHPCHPCGSA